MGLLGFSCAGWMRRALLSANLPGYADYCHKVRYRLIPLVW